jgi:hypothetical protein
MARKEVNGSAVRLAGRSCPVGLDGRRRPSVRPRHASRRPTQQSAVDADGSRGDHDLSPVVERTRQRCGPNRCGVARAPSPNRRGKWWGARRGRPSGQVMLGLGVTSKRVAACCPAVGSPALPTCRRTRTARCCTCAVTPRNAAPSAVGTVTGAGIPPAARPDDARGGRRPGHRARLPQRSADRPLGPGRVVDGNGRRRGGCGHWVAELHVPFRRRLHPSFWVANGRRHRDPEALRDNRFAWEDRAVRRCWPSPGTWCWCPGSSVGMTPGGWWVSAGDEQVVGLVGHLGDRPGGRVAVAGRGHPARGVQSLDLDRVREQAAR